MKFFKCSLILQGANLAFLRDPSNVQKAHSLVASSDIWRYLRVTRFMHVSIMYSLRALSCSSRSRACKILIVFVHRKRSFIRPYAMPLHRNMYL